MTAAPADSIGNGESLLDRALRTRRSAEVFRTAAESAWAESESAYERAQEAEGRAEMAEDAAARAYAAWDAARRPA